MCTIVHSNLLLLFLPLLCFLIFSVGGAETVSATGQDAAAAAAVKVKPTEDAVIEVAIAMGNINDKSVVCDIASLDGRMSIAAARAGAKKVYCIDADPSLARKHVANASGLLSNAQRRSIQFVKAHPKKYYDGHEFSIDLADCSVAIVNTHNVPTQYFATLGQVLFAQLAPGSVILSLHEGWRQFVPIETFSVSDEDPSVPFGKARRTVEGQARGVYKHVVSGTQSCVMDHVIGKSVIFDLSGFLYLPKKKPSPKDASLDPRGVHRLGELSVFKMLSTELPPGQVHMGQISKADLDTAHAAYRARQTKERKATKHLVYDKGGVRETNLADAAGKKLTQAATNIEVDDAALVLSHVFVSALISREGNLSAIRFQVADGDAKFSEVPRFRMRVRDLATNQLVSSWAHNRGKKGEIYSTFRLGNGPDESFGIPLPCKVQVEVESSDIPLKETTHAAGKEESLTDL